MNLNEQMQMGHIVRVHADGTVTDAPREVFGPEAAYVNAEGEEPDPEYGGWEILRGYTGQYGYRGPVMHDSERIGGKLEQDIRERPGLYVALPVDHTGNSREECDGCGAASGEWCTPTCEGGRETLSEGWVVAFKEFPAWKFMPSELVKMPDTGQRNILAWDLKVEREHLRVFLDGQGKNVTYEVRIGDDWYPADDVEGKLRTRITTEFTGGVQLQPESEGPVTLYHFTALASATAILEHGWMPDPQGWVYFTDRQDGQATGYGTTAVAVELHLDPAWLDYEFPDGERHWRVPASALAGRTRYLAKN